MPQSWQLQEKGVQSLSLSHIGVRVKREEELGCDRPLADLDRVYDAYKWHQDCHNNLMVCKSCTRHGMEGVTKDVVEKGFQVWCFSNGTINNTVSLPFTHCIPEDRQGSQQDFI